MFIMNQINLLTLVVIATNHLSGAIIYCFPELICFVKNYIICLIFSKNYLLIVFL